MVNKENDKNIEARTSNAKNTVKTEKNNSSRFRKMKFNNKVVISLLIIVISIFVVVVIVALYLINENNNSNTISSSMKCTTLTNKEHKTVRTIIKNNKSSDLKLIVENYEKNNTQDNPIYEPVCFYIAYEYYLSQKDYNQSINNLRLITENKDKTKTLVKYYNFDINSIDSNVAELEKLDDEKYNTSGRVPDWE